MSVPSHPDASHLILDPLSEHAWRLRDRSFAISDADSVVAYIEQRADALYEVTWVAHAVGVAVYETLEELLHDAAELFAMTKPRGSTKPIPIPHRPPLALT